MASSAGRNFATRKNAAVGATASVRSKTSIDRATTPIESPRSLTVYDPSNRPNGRTRSGSRRLRTRRHCSSRELGTRVVRDCRQARHDSKSSLSCRLTGRSVAPNVRAHRRSSLAAVLAVAAACRRVATNAPRTGSRSRSSRCCSCSRSGSEHAHVEIRGTAALGRRSSRSCWRWRCSARRPPRRSASPRCSLDALVSRQFVRPRARQRRPRSPRSRSSAASRSRSLVGRRRTASSRCRLRGGRLVVVHGREHAQLR